MSSILIPYLYTTVAAILHFRQFNRQIGRFALFKTLIMFVLALTYILFAIIGSGQEVMFYGMVLLFILTPFYSLMLSPNEPKKK